MSTENQNPPASPAAVGSTASPESVQPPTPAVMPDSRQGKIAKWLETAEAPETPAQVDGTGTQEQPAGEPATETPQALSQVSAKKEGEGTPPEGTPPSEETIPRDLAKAVHSIRRLKEARKALKTDLESATTRIKELEAETERLKQASQPKVAPSYDEVEDPAVLEERARDSAQVYQWASQRLDRVVTEESLPTVAAELEAEGIQPPENGWTVEAVRKPLLAMKQNSLASYQAATARKEWLAGEQQALTHTASLVPELEDDKSGLPAEVNQVLVERPWIKRLPDWPLVATVAALGLRELKRRANPPTPAPKPPVAAPAPIIAPRVPGAGARTAPAAATDALADLRKRARAPGATPADRRALIKASLEAAA